MECNKDEAHRGKKIAEEMMLKNDFEGARKFALKAKQLYPELDNISQLVTVCDVHCAAQKRIYGAGKDLYGILQVENVADDTTICKQYRKLALVLHPDKNKFPGAEAAFKLIGEANMTLSDREKRSIYDMQCRESAKASANKIHNHQGNQTSYAGQQNKFKTAPSSQFHGVSRGQQSTSNPSTLFWTHCPFCSAKNESYREFSQRLLRCQQCSKLFIANEIFKTAPSSQFNGVSRGQQSTSNPSTRLTFWTQCPFCSVKYESYREFIERLLRCQQCSKLFIAFEIGPQAHNVNLGSKAQSVNPGSKPGSQQKEAAKVENAKGNIKKDGKVPSNLERKKTEGTRMKQEGVTKPKVSGVRKPMETGTAKATDKRMAAESSEASSDKKEAAGGGVSGGSPNGKRSSRQRQHASYQEGGAGEFSPSKKSKLSKSSGDVAPADVSTPNGKLKQNGKEVVTPDSHSKNDPEPGLVDCPEQDFTNFDKDKEEHCFAVGQIWACYDSVDAMPRFYAQIRKVYSSKFRLRIAWFDSDPDNALEIKWVEEGLPVACGKYELGETEETSDPRMFSHQIVIKKVSKSSYFISPQKGEIWAVYKDWDMKWSMDPENHTKYKFDIGEIVEAGEDCITVGFLLKVKGFVGVFQRSIWAGAGDLKIPCNELFRFSHRIPSAKLTGTERFGVPAGSLELDMASLPADFEDYCSYSSNNVNTASKSHEETVKPVPNLVSTRKKTEGTRMKQEGVTKPKVSGVRKPMETGTAKASDKRMAAESSEASSDKKEAAGGGVSGGSPNGKRSSRQRQHASNQEGGAGEFSLSKKSKLSKSSGDVAPADVSTPNDKLKQNGKEGVTPESHSKKSKLSKSSGDVAPADVSTPNGKLKQNGKEVVTPDSHSKNDPEPELVDCPEQDFTNFDKDKEEHCFAVGQIWACYDSGDGMPRFYAQIRKVYPSKFRLQIAWFESDPDNALEIKWVEEGLPVACGKHELGETEETSNRLMFSHQIVIKKVSKSSYFISPQKGEIWAVYKDWDMKWSMDPENHTKYKFDIVEIVEAGEDCITVGFLLKVKGFVGVFQRSIWAGAGDLKIPCNELFRFSHRIPSAKLTGTERAGVPAGSFELDMASLPADFEDYCSYSSNNVNTASKSHEETVKPVPNLVSTPKKRIDKDSTRLTFRTYCPFCSVKYGYSREYIQRPLRCQQCSKVLIAYEIGPQAHNVNLGSKPVSQQKEAAKAENAKGNIKKDGKDPSNLERKKTEGTRMKQEGVTKPKVSGVLKPMETGTAKASDKRMAAESSEAEGTRMKQEGVTKPKVSGVRKPMETGTAKASDKRMAAESSEASSDKKEAAGGGVSGGSPNGKRSSRQRQHASNQEGGAGEFSLSKKSKLSKSSGDVAPADVSTPNGKLKQNGKEVVTPDSHSKNDPELELVDCPEQDFTNFDKDKEEHCFAVGQIWACYDSVDAMPRFYAQIRKVYSSKFRLRIAWFDSDPDNALEIKWVEEGLPVACGKYELGETEETSDPRMFSHQIVIKKVSNSSYFISPQKGEIWAVYKDWDMKWSMDPENHTKYKFDIVEIVEAGEDCITVGFLLKVKGFVGVFQRSIWAGAGDLKIPCNELFRFSHRIPSAKLTGTERAGVPAGSLELDMASLPADFEDYCSFSSNNVNTASKSHEETVKPVPNLVSTPKKTKVTRMKQEGVTKPKVSGVRKPMETGTAKATDQRMAAESSEASSDKKEAAGGGVSGGSSNGKRSSQQRQQASYQEGGAGEFSPSKKSKLSKSFGNVAPADVSTPNGKLKQNGKEVVTPDSHSKNDPEPELVDCPEQDFTNFDKDKEEHCFAVGQIWACYDSVDAMPRFYAQIRKVYSSKFRLRIAWFESDPDNALEIKWVEEGLPVACGKYELGVTEETSNCLMFSHQVVIKKVSKSSYFVSPQKGEIWAVYKDWDMKWSMDSENHTKYKFDIVEIVEAGEDCITVGFLLKVKGFVSVFQRSNWAGAGDLKIPCNELFRFSHRIPSAKLTGTERAGVPAGSFELDMASLPADFEDYCAYSSNNVNTASKSHEETVKPVPNLVSTPKKRIDMDSTLKLRRSPRGLGNQKI